MGIVRRDINYDNVTSPDEITDDTSSKNLIFILTIVVLSFLLVFVPVIRWMCQRYACHLVTDDVTCRLVCQHIQVTTPIIVISGSEVTRREDTIMAPFAGHHPNKFSSSVSLTSRDVGHFRTRSCDCHSRCCSHVNTDQNLCDMSGYSNLQIRRDHSGYEEFPIPIRRPHSCSCLVPERGEIFRMPNYFRDYSTITNHGSVSPVMTSSHVTSSPIQQGCCYHCDSRPMTPLNNHLTSTRDRLHSASTIRSQLRSTVPVHMTYTPDLLMTPCPSSNGNCQTRDDEFVLPGQSPRLDERYQYTCVCVCLCTCARARVRALRFYSVYSKYLCTSVLLYVYVCVWGCVNRYMWI